MHSMTAAIIGGLLLTVGPLALGQGTPGSELAAARAAWKKGDYVAAKATMWDYMKKLDAQGAEDTPQAYEARFLYGSSVCRDASQPTADRNLGYNWLRALNQALDTEMRRVEKLAVKSSFAADLSMQVSDELKTCKPQSFNTTAARSAPRLDWSAAPQPQPTNGWPGTKGKAFPAQSRD